MAVAYRSMSIEQLNSMVEFSASTLEGERKYLEKLKTDAAKLQVSFNENKLKMEEAYEAYSSSKSRAKYDAYVVSYKSAEKDKEEYDIIVNEKIKKSKEQIKKYEKRYYEVVAARNAAWIEEYGHPYPHTH